MAQETSQITQEINWKAKLAENNNFQNWACWTGLLGGGALKCTSVQPQNRGFPRNWSEPYAQSGLPKEGTKRNGTSLQRSKLPGEGEKKSIKGFYPKTAKLWENDDPAFMKCSCLNSLPMPSRNNGMTRGIGPPVPLLLLETAPGQTEVSRVNLLTMVPNMPCTSGNWSHL